MFSHTSILCELIKLFICEKAHGEITQTISAQQFPICKNNIPHKRLSTLKRHHKTSARLKPHAGKIYPNHSPLNSSSHTPILSMYHLSHYSICVSLSFITRNFSSAKNEKPICLTIIKNTLYTQAILKMIGGVKRQRHEIYIPIIRTQVFF